MRAATLSRCLLGVAVTAASAQPVAWPEDLADPSEAAKLCCGSLSTPSRGDPNGPPLNPGVWDRDLLFPKPVALYGRVNAGLTRRDRDPSQRIRADPCGSPQPERVPDWAVDSIERSRVGLRTTEVLTGGHLAHLNLEQSLALDTGKLSGACQQLFDARATIGLSDRRWGRVDIGRIDQAAWQLALRADPWGGNGTASPGWRTYAVSQLGATRSTGTVTYSTPGEWPWRLAAQIGRPLQFTEARRGSGGSLAWDRLPWLVGVGWQTWPDGSRALPLVVMHDSGTTRVSGALTVGRVQGTDYRNLFIGFAAPVMAKGDPEREEWRAGLNVHRVEGGGVGDWQSDTKLGAGWRYRFTRHTWLALGGALIKPHRGGSRIAYDISLTYAFDRDLRVPQGPR